MVIIAIGFTIFAILLVLIQALVEVFSGVRRRRRGLIAARLGRRVTLRIGVGVMIASNALLATRYAICSHFRCVESALGFVGIRFFTAGFNFGFGAMGADRRQRHLTTGDNAAS